MQNFNLKTSDCKLIADVIEAYGDRTANEILYHIQRIFKHDIGPAHYIVFGQLIGELHRPNNRVLINTNN